MTIIVTLVGTFFGVILTTMLAYSITRKEMRYSKQLSFFVYLPFLFNGGMVPFYMLLLKLGFKDQLYGLIIPMLINSFNVFLMVKLKLNESKDVLFTITPRQMAFIDNEGKCMLEPGRFRIFIGGGQPETERNEKEALSIKHIDFEVIGKTMEIEY